MFLVPRMTMIDITVYKKSTCNVTRLQASSLFACFNLITFARDPAAPAGPAGMTGQLKGWFTKNTS